MRHSLYVICCCAVGLYGPSNLAHAANTADGHSQNKAQHTQQLKRLRQDIAAVKQHMQTTQGERSELNKTLEKSEQHIGALTKRLRDLRQQRKQTQKHLQQLQHKAQQQQQILNHERALLQRQVQAAYATGRQEKIKILLNQQDPTQLSRVLTYYSYLNRERIKRMQQIRDYLAQLNTTRQQIVDQQQELATLETKQRAEKQNMLAAQKSRRQLLAKLNQRLQSQEEKLQQLHADEKRLEKLLANIQKALARAIIDTDVGKKFKAMRGRLNWPTQGKLAARFGAPKIGGLRWDGVMISAPAGREIRASHYGRVAFADWFRGFGLLLIIDHGDGYMSLYGHNQSLFKEVGDWIEAGEPVAAVGSTGGRKQAGVYFAIRHNGRAINPARWCKKPRGNQVG
jgi:septal ring factor EnvC (AmiA/AmiB activator)